MNEQKYADIPIDGDVIKLPIVQMSNGVTIDFFNPYDVKLMAQLMPKILERINKIGVDRIDTIIVPATKPIPIAWYVAYTLHKDLVVIEKNIKPYHTNISLFKAKSITSNEVNRFFVKGEDIEKIKNKNVLFLDDVVSTGATYAACKEFLTHNMECKSFKSLFVFKEGDSFTLDEDASYIGYIPFG